MECFNFKHAFHTPTCVAIYVILKSRIHITRRYIEINFPSLLLRYITKFDIQIFQVYVQIYIYTLYIGTSVGTCYLALLYYTFFLYVFVIGALWLVTIRYVLYSYTHQSYTRIRIWRLNFKLTKYCVGTVGIFITICRQQVRTQVPTSACINLIKIRISLTFHDATLNGLLSFSSWKHTHNAF